MLLLGINPPPQPPACQSNIKKIKKMMENPPKMGKFRVPSSAGLPQTAWRETGVPGISVWVPWCGHSRVPWALQPGDIKIQPWIEGHHTWKDLGTFPWRGGSGAGWNNLRGQGLMVALCCQHNMKYHFWLVNPGWLQFGGCRSCLG